MVASICQATSKVPEVPDMHGNQGLMTRTLQVSRVISGWVMGYGQGRTLLHIANGVKGVLHPMDT